MVLRRFRSVIVHRKSSQLAHCASLIFLLMLSLFLILAVLQAVAVESAQETYLQGKITDFETNLPLSGAEVIVRASRTPDIRVIYTDLDGRYNATFPGGGYYYVTAWKWATGATYAPSEIYQQLEIGQSYVFDFSLRHGAMVNLKGDCHFLDNPNPPQSYRFTVLDAQTDNALSLSCYYPRYGDWGINPRLGITTTLVIVPADTEVCILVEAYRGGLYSRSSYQNLRLKELISLPNGGYTELDMTDQSLAQNLDVLGSSIVDAKESLSRLEEYGFYLGSKKQNLAVAEEWFENSRKELYENRFAESYSDMRQAFLITENALDGMASMQNDASNSTYFITFFMFVTSTVLAHFFFEKYTSKRLSSLVFYAAILGVTYFIYPGYRSISLSAFSAQVALSLFFVFLVIELSNQVLTDKGSRERISFRGAVGAAFSIAKRNLRRRKLNCVTMTISLVILIAAFVDLTSVSEGYGFTTYPSPKVYSQTEGIFVRPYLGGNPISFIPISSEFMSSLSSLHSENISMIAPKAENQPVQIDRIPLGVLTGPVTATNISIFGVLGISPSEEAKVTHIDRTLAFGRYLSNGDSDAVLISVQAAHELNASGNLRIGDRLQLFLSSSFSGIRFDCTLVGLMDDAQLTNLADLNGDQILPKALYPTPAGYTMRPADSDKIIVMNYPTVSSWPGIVTSRVNILCRSSEYIIPLASQIVLTTPYNAWVTVKEQSYLLYVGRYAETEGADFSVLFILVMLNIATTMLMAIENRKNEMVTLATVGLNPSHIITIFMSEALVVGLLGGGLGYFFGMLGYAAMNLTKTSLAFEQKISFSWSILSVFFAIVVSIVSTAISTFKVTKNVTPSFKGRWNPEENQLKVGEYWSTDMPIKIMEYELDQFVNFVYGKMRETKNNRIKGIREIELRRMTDAEGLGYDIDFDFISGETVSQPINTKNTLEIRRKEGYCTVYLRCKPSVGTVGSKTKFQFRETSLFTRSLLLLWGSQSFTVAAPFYDSHDHLIGFVGKYQPKEVNLLVSQEKSKEISGLIEILKERGVKVPFFKLFLVDPFDFYECLKKAKSAAKEAEIICISGGTDQMNSALAWAAQAEKKKVSYYIEAKGPKPLFAEFRPEEEKNITG